MKTLVQKLFAHSESYIISVNIKKQQTTKGDGMKKLFSVISLLLVAVISFSFAPVAFAQSADGLTVLAETQIEDGVEADGEADNGTEGEVASDKVARIHFATRSTNVIGHAWIYVENLSEEVITVGQLDVAPDEGVSIGLFALSRKESAGIYYNIEAYSINYNNSKGVYSISKELTREELEKASRTIYEYIDHWDPFLNCSLFASKVWNSVSEKKVPYTMFPLFQQLIIRIFGAQRDSLQMIVPAEDNIYHQKGTGDKAQLLPVSEKSRTNDVA